MSTPAKVLLLLSGGLDSVTLLHHYHHSDTPVQCVLFPYHQKHVQELEFAKWHCHRLKALFHTLDLPHLQGSALTDKGQSWVVPGRNAIMLSVACNLAESLDIPLVSFGANAGDADEFPDCRKRFVDAFNEMLFQSELRVRVIAPFLSRNKSWIRRYADDMGIKLNEIWTCYNGGQQPCGECPACQKLQAVA